MKMKMSMFKAISLVGLAVIAVAVACSAQFGWVEREKLKMDSQFFLDLSEKYRNKAAQKTVDAPYWDLAASIVKTIDATRRNILFTAFQHPEAEWAKHFEEAKLVNEEQVRSLQMLLRFGDMNTKELKGEIAQIQQVIRRQPGQIAS